jgi:hypothetical protein
VGFDSAIVEIKAVAHLTSLEEVRVINYPRASGRSVGPLVSYGPRSLENRRLVLSRVIPA